jgi:hypothetical protein
VVIVAATKNFDVDQNATFSFYVEYKDSQDNPIDLTGATAKMQVRDLKGGKQLVATLSTPHSSGIDIDGPAGIVNVIIPAASTNKFIYPKSAYDLVITDTNGNKIRLLEGFLTLNRSVTI